MSAFSQFLDHPAQFCEIRYVKIVGSVAELSDAYLQSLALYYRRLAYALQAHGRQTCTAQSRHGRFAARMSEVVDVVVGDSHEVESGIDEIVHIFRRHAEYVVSLGIAHLAALARTIQKTAFEIATRNIDTPEDAVGVGKQIAAPFGGRCEPWIESGKVVPIMTSPTNAIVRLTVSREGSAIESAAVMISAVSLLGFWLAAL